MIEIREVAEEVVVTPKTWSVYEDGLCLGTCFPSKEDAELFVAAKEREAALLGFTLGPTPEQSMEHYFANAGTTGSWPCGCSVEVPRVVMECGVATQEDWPLPEPDPVGLFNKYIGNPLPEPDAIVENGDGQEPG
jgi:hypothetical protein